MARTKAKTTEVKELRPKDLLGLKGHGGEPKIPENLTENTRISFMGKCFNWYNYFCTNKEAKQFIMDYLVSIEETTTAKKLVRVPDSKVRPTFGWMARLALRGFVITKEEQERIHVEVKRLIDADIKDNPIATAEEVIETAESQEAAKRGVQQVMRERASDVAGEIQGLLDDYIKQGYKTNADVTTKVINLMSEKNILPQHVSIVSQPWTVLKTELQEVVKEADEQIVEGYSHLSKNQLKNLIKFVDQVLSNISSYTTLKQATKAKRAKKPVSVEKTVSKLKYARKFKDEKQKLDLVSIEPTKLHNSTEAWCYDTAKRKLYHFVADNVTKCLIVKGNALLGFDTKESEAKILRKPSEQIKQIMGSKPAARKFFDDIKAVSTTPNGRFNANMIILRAF
jgi:hypothetical protein